MVCKERNSSKGGGGMVMVKRQHKKGRGGDLKNELHNTKTIAREQGLFL